jgi:DNA-binding transcriptional ArsR family regulator
MIDDGDLIEALKALAHPLRWRILTALAAGERNVGEIETATGISQPGLSQQLGVLRKASLVKTRKDAKMVFYALARNDLAAVTTAISALAPADTAPMINHPAQHNPAPGVANFARMS